MKVKFLIGEFAELMNIPKQTLRYYDSIDLFKPNFIDTENKYRYYSINQTEILDTILILKELDVPLKHIKKYINNRDVEKCISLLKGQKSKINDKINKLSKIKDRLDRTIDNMGKYKNMNNEDNVIKVEDFEEQYLIINKVDKPNDDTKIVWSILEIMNKTRLLDVNTFHENGAVVVKDDILSGNYKRISFVFVKVNKYLDSSNIHIKPRGRYASIYHKGRYEDSYKSYIKLLNFVEKNNLEIISDAYEISIIDGFSNSLEEEFLTEIQVRVVEKIS